MIVGIVIGVLALLVYVFLSVRKMNNIPVVADNEKIKALTDKNFNHQVKNGVVLVDFWASWCAPCKMMAPVLNEIAGELTGNKSIGKLNVEHYQSVSTIYKVKGIPTMILFKDGKEVNRFVGVKSKDFLLKEMNKVN
jgi:thioredoxin 1